LGSSNICISDKGDTETLPDLSLQPGEVITCTFTKTLQRGSINIVKNTVGGDDTFAFTSNSFTQRSFDLNTATAGGTASTSFSDLIPGTYDMAEKVHDE